MIFESHAHYDDEAFDEDRKELLDALPVKFKFGTDDEPCYHTFQTVEELTDFYVQSIKYIQGKLDIGWDKKDAFSLDSYRV